MNKERRGNPAIEPPNLEALARHFFEKIITHKKATDVEAYMELRNLLVGLFINMSDLQVEGYDNFLSVPGAAELIAPHETPIDFVGVSAATDSFIRYTYLEQSILSKGYLGTLMGKYAGGIPVNKASSVRKIYAAFDRGEKVLIFPEGDNNQGKLAVARSLNEHPIEIPTRYPRHSKLAKDIRLNVPIIPIGLEYVRSEKRPPVSLDSDMLKLAVRLFSLLPKPPMGILTPPPWATSLIVRFGEPIYPANHPDLTMDDCMRFIAKLSNRPYGPDIERVRKVVSMYANENS